ncbi:MAG: redox-regulated ATPase YchF [Patescibacteria group bacterium]|mgnify:CR=1 FL=1
MLQVGIVGLPNVGKSTLFKTLTKKAVPCENFPFCTIEPNVGMVEVPDERLHQLSMKSASQKTISTAIEFVDIAGIVRGAHKGEGLGNKFLSHIREVDMIAHVVRSFADPNVTHVDGSVDATRDVETIEIELATADLDTVKKYLETVRSKMKAGKTKEIEKEFALLERLETTLGTGTMASTVEMDEEEKKMIKSLSLLTMKPILYIVNVDETSAADKNWTSPLGANRLAIPLSVKIESELVELPKEEAQTFMAELGLDESGLDRVIKKCYELLNLITYFTSGEKESRAWTITKGTKAPQAAGVIHTDFEKAFICGEIMNWKDFVDLGEAGAKAAGKLRIEGKEYLMQDGDTCHFKVGI